MSFKKILSYVFDFPIEKRKSQFSDEVIVSLYQGQYKLSTKNAIYSFGKNYTSFDIAFKAVNIQEQEIKTVLVLGFGLGSVVDLLEKHPAITSVTAVDADEVIMELAGKYLQSSLKNKVIFICSDAEIFVQQELKAYDLVVVDLFIDDLTPVKFMQLDFLTELKKRVATNGCLLFSKIDDSHKSNIENAQFEKKFSAVFQDSFSIDADGNKLFAWWNK